MPSSPIPGKPQHHSENVRPSDEFSAYKISTKICPVVRKEWISISLVAYALDFLATGVVAQQTFQDVIEMNTLREVCVPKAICYNIAFRNGLSISL